MDDDESVYNIPVAGGSGSTPGASGSLADDHMWPSMQDLNTRLRRVITSYQRNYKKEELKQQQKAKVISPILFGSPTGYPSGLPWKCCVVILKRVRRFYFCKSVKLFFFRGMVCRIVA